MAKLNQIVAVVSGKKTRTSSLLTDAHRWQKDSLSGITRSYEPLSESGEALPSESRNVQTRVNDTLRKISSELADYYDVVATQETGNTKARADVRVNNQVIAKSVPLSVLLFLEKQITDIRTFVDKIPTLPADREWTFDKNRNCYISGPSKQARTQKVLKNFVKFEPTQYQPGQSEIVTVDDTVGWWSVTHFSGAIPEKDRCEMLDRVDSLLDAIKVAREEANSIEVEPTKIGKDIFEYVFGKDAVRA